MQSYNFILSGTNFTSECLKTLWKIFFDRSDSRQNCLFLQMYVRHLHCLILLSDFCILQMFGYIWQYVYTFYLRFWLKWLIRQVTGTCELQRICSGYKAGALRTTKAGKLPLTFFFFFAGCYRFFIFIFFLCCLLEYSLQSSKSKVEILWLLFHIHDWV